MILSAKDLQKLHTLHPDLQAVIVEAAANCEEESFIVTEGVRTKERQVELYFAKKSKTMDSRHFAGADGLSRAVDLAVWYDRDEDKVVDADELSWKFSDYEKLAQVVKGAAKKLGVPIVWGGDWKSFKDGPHFELDRKEYP